MQCARIGLHIGLWLMILPTAVGACSSFGADSPTPRGPEPLESGAVEEAGEEAGADSEPGVDAGVAGIIGWWPLDAFDSFGAVPDISGFGHDGDLSSGGEKPTFVTADGRHKAIKMSGSPFAIRGLDANFFPKTGTLAVWVRQTTADGGADIVDMYEQTRSHLFIRIQDNNHQISMQRGVDIYVFDWSAPAKDRWTHLAITWSDADQRATTYLETSQVKTCSTT